MKNLFLGLLLAFTVSLSPLCSQNPEFPNAIQTKINVTDFGLLYDGTPKIGQSFEFGYARYLMPYLSAVVPVRLGLSKLPEAPGNIITNSFDLVIKLENMKTGGKLSPYAFGGGGYFIEDFSKSHIQIPVGAGINFRVSPYAFLNVHGEFRKSVNLNRDNLQIGIGYVYLLHEYVPPPPNVLTDTDKDGVPDISDKCPALAGAATAGGCPDADGDGLTDEEDGCPTESGLPATTGCPDFDSDGLADKDDPCPTVSGDNGGCPDADADGTPDKDDKCPEKPGPIGNKGCPMATSPDDDGDGVPNDRDECPITPGKINGCPDTDADGTPDKDDECPITVGKVKGCPDTDADGAPDKDDACPSVPGTLNGCPDSDGDGIADPQDKCPAVAGVAENNGCPPVKDTDGDGTPDEADKCPAVAGVAENNGCPPVKDTDGDGTPDEADKCPAVSGPLANAGCPVPRDSDADGVPDAQDKCPLTAGPVTNSGCPEIKTETKAQLAYATRAVQFQTGSAILKNESYAVLDTVLLVMRQYPDYELAIAGYTDNVGSDAKNMALSKNRAKACYDYLIFRGVKVERLRFAGFGAARPVAANATEEGRERNRRVEFELLLN